MLVEWTLLNDNENHFSYEDMGSLRLSLFILVIQIFLGVMTTRSYLAAIRTHERYLSPHPIMLMSLMTQITAQFLQTIHLWQYSADGDGFTVLDILSKIA